MSHLTAARTRRVTPALRLAVACAADHCRRALPLSAGARQPTARWRITGVINRMFPQWRFQRLVRDEPRRSMPAPRATNATSESNTARTAARFAFGWDLAGCAHTATNR